MSRLIDGAREGARSWREHELVEVGSAVLSALDRGEFDAARARVAEAAEKLGSEPELLELGQRIEARQRERQAAEAEAERLQRQLESAEAALATGDVPAALSRITEVLTRWPNDARARSLAARIDARRRADEARAIRSAQQTTGPSASEDLGALRPAVPSWHEAPTAEIPVVGAAAPPAPAPAATPGVSAAPGPRYDAPPAAPAPGARPRRASRLLPGLAIAALAAVVAVGGWQLWRGMNGAEPDRGDGASVPAAYREGLTALAARDSATAAKRLRAAIAADGVERRGYLPWFHLGQALVTGGDCDEGLKALDASERQGVVASTPEAALLPTLRAGCATAPDVEQQLRPVDEALSLLERQIAEVEGSKTAAEVAAMWASRPQLEADLEATKRLVDRAEKLAARARSERQLDLAFQAADAAADARAKLAAVLRAAAAQPPR